MSSENIGISNIVVHIPKSKMGYSEMANLSGISEEFFLKKTGILNKRVLQKDKSSIDMAVDAVRHLLNKSKTSPSDLDYIIYCSVGISDQYLWSAAAKIQNLIGAHNAFSFEIVNGCNAGNLGIQIASNMLKGDQTKNNALVVISDTLSRIVDYANPDHLCISNFSDGAGAILVQRGERRNNILSFYAKTEAEFVDHMCVPAHSSYVVMSDDAEEDKRLSDKYKQMYPHVIRTALEKAKLSLQDVKWFFINQGDHKLIDYLSKELAVSDSKIHKSYAQHGHMGGVDVFFGLCEKEKSGEIVPGDIVVLASSAIGFSWGASVIRA